MTPQEKIALMQRAAQMLVLSIDMQYVGGFGETAKKGDALALLARHLFVWVHEIEGEAK